MVRDNFYYDFDTYAQIIHIYLPISENKHPNYKLFIFQII